MQGATTPEVVVERQWRTPTQLNSDLIDIASSNEEVTIETIGHSRNGQPITSIRLARSGSVPIEDRSAILIVAGIDGDHLLGCEVALDMVEELLSRNTEETKVLLEDHVLYIIPQVNPDGVNAYFNSVQEAHRRNIRPVDNDRDGAFDEDGGDDLNGDGLITMMRVPDLEKATLIADPEHPRLDIEPDPLEGQAATFLLYIEGIDNDGDGKYNEDSSGGVDLNKNFMHGYQYHGDGSGPWQLSEPESKALADYVLGHQQIAAIIVYGQHDTLSSPLGEGGSDAAGAPKKLDSGDEEVYKQISERFVELTSLKNVDQPNWDGSFVAWAYAQYGVPAFSTPLWTRPEPIEDESSGDAEHEEKDTEEASSSDRDSSRRGGFDRQAMMEEFDTDGDGELNDDERQALRDSMQDRFGGGHQGGWQRGPRGGPSGERPRGGGSSTEDSNLTPSGVGDISQETIDELLAAAGAAGYPITDEMMEDITPQQIEQYAKMSGIQIRRVHVDEGNTKKSEGDVAWLDYSDNQRDGEGFVPWTPFEHPQLGTVEIGGWAPYFRTVPTTDVIEETTPVQADFILDLASKLPIVHLGETVIAELGNGLFEIKVAVINDGWLPSGTAMAKRNKRARPYIVRLEVPHETIVTGQKVNRIWSLDGGGTRKWFRWIIQGSPNSSIDITLLSEKFGSETISTTLQDTTGGNP